MARQVRWTLIAASDLEQVVEYIGRDSPHYAASLAQRVMEAARSLDERPNRGRMVPELRTG